MRRIALAGCFVAMLSGCQSFLGVADAEIPGDAIAIHYRTPEEARRRAEAARDVAAAPGAPRGTRIVGHAAQLRADVGVLGDYFSGLLSPDAEPERHAGRLALLDPRSARVEVIANARRGSIPLAWSDDRERLLFSQPLPGGADVQIFELELATRELRRVTWGPPLHTQACYAAEGRIAVTALSREREGHSWIRISGPGGRGPFRDLSPGPADHHPTCAADGAGLAFARSDARGGSEIWVLRPLPDGTARRLVPGYHPRFSADGEWLLYTAARRDGPRIQRIRIDGSARAPIGPTARGGRGARAETWPTASPDGKLVAYVSAEEPPRRHLYLRRFDGSGDRILFADGDGEYPVW